MAKVARSSTPSDRQSRSRIAHSLFFSGREREEGAQREREKEREGGRERREGGRVGGREITLRLVHVKVILFT